MTDDARHSCQVRLSVVGNQWRGFGRSCRIWCPKAVQAALDIYRQSLSRENQAMESPAMESPAMVSPAMENPSRGGTLDEVSILLTDDADMRRLNHHYRGIDQRTNVLAFTEAADGPRIRNCGDLALGAQIIQEEAVSRRTNVPHHVAHLVIHGTLHLLGYTHDTDDACARMEKMETAALASLGIADPYRDEVMDG